MGQLFGCVFRPSTLKDTYSHVIKVLRIISLGLRLEFISFILIVRICFWAAKPHIFLIVLGLISLFFGVDGTKKRLAYYKPGGEFGWIVT